MGADDILDSFRPLRARKALILQDQWDDGIHLSGVLILNTTFPAAQGIRNFSLSLDILTVHALV